MNCFTRAFGGVLQHLVAVPTGTVVDNGVGLGDNFLFTNVICCYGNTFIETMVLGIERHCLSFAVADRLFKLSLCGMSMLPRRRDRRKRAII